MESRNNNDLFGASGLAYSPIKVYCMKYGYEYREMQINGWFTKKWRQITPAVPILLVAAFVTAMVQIVANPGLFVQLANGFLAIQNPVAASNWLLTKNAWWFFGHPIVYFPLLIFLVGLYFFIPR